MYIDTEELKTIIGSRDKKNVEALLVSIPFIDTRRFNFNDEELYKLDTDEIKGLKNRILEIEKTFIFNTIELRRIMHRQDIQLLLCRTDFTKLETNKKRGKCRTFEMTEDDMFKLWCFVHKKFVDYDTAVNRANFKKQMKAEGVEF